MLFSLLKHYLELYISGTALKVSWSLYCFTTSLCHGVENYFPRLWGMGISDAISVISGGIPYIVHYNSYPIHSLFFLSDLYFWCLYYSLFVLYHILTPN